MFQSNKKSITLLIGFLSLGFFLFKWYLPFENFEENINTKVIFESLSDGYYYFPELKSLVNFNLSNSFDPFVKNLGTIAIPTGAFFLHFIFYLIFDVWCFIILEFFFITIFIVIFYKISRLLNLDRLQSVAVALILFNIPFFFELLNLNNVQYFNVIFSEFYSFRFPRPMVSNIFFFVFILFVLRLNKNKIFTKKNSIIFGTISGFSFTSFYHFFILEQLFIISFLLINFKSEIIKELRKNIKYVFLYIFSFLIISSPSLINIYFVEGDYLERLGLISLNFEKKIMLIKYLFFKLFKIQFLIVFILSIILFVIINFNKKFFIFKKLNIFLIFFYLSVISPFLFIITTTNSFSQIYLFNNIIIICAFLLFFFTTCLIIDSIFKKNLFLKLGNIFAILLIITSVFINIYQTKNNYNKINLSNENLVKREEFNLITNTIENINNLKKNDITLLTFDNRFLTWSILKNIKYLNIINGVFVSKKNEMIENDVISVFKFLELNREDFTEFIENRKLSEWRYRNENIKSLFWMRYQANSLITFKNSKNFDKKIVKFINNSSPLLSQQLILPNEEIERLLFKFDSNLSTSFSTPKIIIINKNNPVLARSNINLNKYCKSFDGKFYSFYYSFNLYSKCIN